MKGNDMHASNMFYSCPEIRIIFLYYFFTNKELHIERMKRKNIHKSSVVAEGDSTVLT